MLGIDRSAARYTWTAALVVLLLWLVYLVRGTLFIFILALLFAYLLSPLVNLIDRFLPGSRTRTLALALAYVIFVAAIVLVGNSDRLARGGAGHLTGEDIPRHGGRLAAAARDRSRRRWRTKCARRSAKRSSDLISALPQFGVRFLAVASNLVYVVIIPILAFLLPEGRPA